MGIDVGRDKFWMDMEESLSVSVERGREKRDFCLSFCLFLYIFRIYFIICTFNL